MQVDHNASGTPNPKNPDVEPEGVGTSVQRGVQGPEHPSTS